MKVIDHKKIHFYIALCIAFLLPIDRLVPVFIILLFANWIIEGDLKNKFKTAFSNKFSLLFISFYLLYIISLTYTENIHVGLFKLEVKLSLLLFPIILSSRPMTKKETDSIFMSLIAGTILSSLIMLCRSSYLYFAKGENTFFYTAFSILMHPGYLSMYINVATAWLIIHLTQRSDKNNRTIIWASIIILFFALTIVLLSSKSGIITFVLIILTLFIYLTFIRKYYLIGISGIILFYMMVLGIKHYSPYTASRIDDLIKAFTNTRVENKQVYESTSMRLLIWEASHAIIKRNPILGVGPGDSKDELIKEYKRRDMSYAITNNYNAHNQFYQTFIGLGIIGELTLLLMLILPLFNVINKKNIVYISFISIIIVNFLAESVLETQSGTMFYGLFNSLLCFQIDSANNKLRI